uniref:Uncharacterized protein n=1 Tax=Avena sativa TaxID=4498 RepID=A0ACD5TRS1_AVESA
MRGPPSPWRSDKREGTGGMEMDILPRCPRRGEKELVAPRGVARLFPGVDQLEGAADVSGGLKWRRQDVLPSVGQLVETKFLCGVTLEVRFLKDELMRLHGYLKDAETKRRSGNIGVAVLVSQIKDAAYDAQNVIEAADYLEKRNRLKKGFMGAISRSKAHGWIEEIRVHDILHDWCIEEAKQDGFLHVIHKTSGQGDAPSIDILTSYRSSYQDFRGQNMHATHNLRALIGFQLPPISLPKLRFLRVLHIEDTSLDNLSSAIGGCIHLRCLRLVRCKGVTLPSSIVKLIYLQTIDMTDTHSVLPESIWDIPSLRHVYLCWEFYPPRGVQQKELRIFRLQHGIDISKRCNLDMVRFLGKMTQLSTLSVDMYKCMPMERLDIFASMPRLFDIHLNSPRALDKLTESHHFPQSLRSFHLVADSINQDPMLVLEKLKCLVVLKLEGYSGRTMSCSTLGFPRLQNLELYSFSYTEEWTIGVGAMPKLTHVILEGFLKMSKLPKGFLNLPSLNCLELEDMPLISVRDNSTSKELQQKGCKVTLIK